MPFESPIRRLMTPLYRNKGHGLVVTKKRSWRPLPNIQSLCPSSTSPTVKCSSYAWVGKGVSLSKVHELQVSQLQWIGAIPEARVSI